MWKIMGKVKKKKETSWMSGGNGKEKGLKSLKWT
jgi:hypothetical protein